jgi:hypothetical protein
MPASSMSSLARAERVAERTKSKQRQSVQEPPKKKPKNKGSQLADQGAQQPRTQDTLLSSSGPSDALLTLPSFDFTNPSPEDYNERTPERTDLLTRLKSHLKDDPITSTFWACCQLCDTVCLEYLVKSAEMSPNYMLVYDMSLSTIPSLCKSLDFSRLITVKLTLYRDPTTPGYFRAVSVASSTYDEGRSKKNSNGEEWVPHSKIQADLVSLFCA